MKKIFIAVCMLVLTGCSKDSDISSASETGKNGSIARFAIKGDLMYAIDLNYLRVFNISDSDHLQLVQSTEVDYGLETIFIYDHYIYLGAVNGVYVIEINNPTNPVQLEKIEHHISCDPVVVQNNIAYSTQRVSATGCGNNWMTSALAIYDVSDVNNPVLRNQLSLSGPYGLAIENHNLFVCDPLQGGIIVFDITDPIHPEQHAIATVSEPRDLILNYPYMLVATENTFELFNYADPLNIHHVSTFDLY